MTPTRLPSDSHRRRQGPSNGKHKEGRGLHHGHPRRENQIVVAPGANARLDLYDIAQARDIITDARLLLLQLEITMDAVVAAVAGPGESTSVILNASPALPVPFPRWRRVDALVLNQHEAATLLGRAEEDASEAAVHRFGQCHVPSKRLIHKCGRLRTPDNVGIQSPHSGLSQPRGPPQGHPRA